MKRQKLIARSDVYVTSIRAINNKTAKLLDGIHTYTFVLLQDHTTIYAHTEPFGGHTSFPQLQYETSDEVCFAGNFRYDRTNGLLAWDNHSGHYRRNEVKKDFFPSDKYCHNGVDNYIHCYE